MHTLGIILAGGASRRMSLPAGETKAGVVLGGRTLLDHVCRAVRPEVDRLVVVAAPGQTVPVQPEIDEIIRDSRPGAGPLAGIADGLRSAAPGTKRAFVVSCDVPLLRRELVRLLLARLEDGHVRWVVPWVNDHPQVLVSAMRVNLLPEIEAHLAAGRHDPRGLLDRLRSEPAGGENVRRAAAVRFVSADEITAVDPQRMSFIDADTPEDIEQLGAILPRFPPSRG